MFARGRASGSAGFVDGFLATIAVDVHFEDRGVVHDAIDGGERHGLITGHLWMPQRLTGELLRSGSLTRIIHCMAAAFRSANDALAEGRR